MGRSQLRGSGGFSPPSLLQNLYSLKNAKPLPKGVDFTDNLEIKGFQDPGGLFGIPRDI